MKSKFVKHIGIFLAAALSFSAVSVAALTISSTRASDDVVEANAALSNYGYKSGEYKYYSGTYYDSKITDSIISSGGTTLLSKLNELIEPSSAFGYGNIWTFNEEYDCYPSNYNGTDPLTGNTYPTTDNTAKRGKMWDMYSDKTWTGTSQRAGNVNSAVGVTYNREHSLPKSWFGGSDSNQPGTDPNHLFNTDGRVNGDRSDNPYGEVTKVTKNLYTWTSGCVGFGKLGTNSNGTTVFEPDDAYKGDFARAQMYMAAAYYDWNLAQSEGSTCFTYSGGVSTMKSYYIDLLTKWSNQDPVSQKEIDRNNAVYSQQGNRNPFIDHPCWANDIWGGTTYTWGSSTTPTVNSVTVTPETLNLNLAGTTTGQLTATVSVSGGAAQTVEWTSSNSSIATVSSLGLVTAKAVGTTTITAKSTVDTSKSDTCTVTVVNETPTPTISVSASSSSIAVNGTSTLTATTENAGTPTITWSVTSGSSYVTLSSTSGSSITVTGKAAGSATIKASMTVSGTTYSDSATITVTSSSSTTYSIIFKGNGTANEGSTAISAANLISADYYTSNTLVSSCTSATQVFQGKNETGLKIGGKSSTGSFTLSILSAAQNSVTKISVATAQYGTDTGTLSLKSGSTTLVSSFNPADSCEYTFSTASTVSSITLATSSKRAYISSITFTIGGSVTPTPEKVLDSISATYTGDDIYVGGILDETAFTVTASYTDSTTYPNETVSGWTVSGFDSSEAGTNIVTITYEGKTCTVNLTILETSVVPTGDGGEASWTASSQNKSNGTEAGTQTSSHTSITIVFDKGSNNNAPKFYGSSSHVRVYGGGTFTVTSTKSNIKKIALTFGSGEDSNEITVDSGTYSNGTWTCSGTTYVSSVEFTVGGTSGHRRIAGIVVTYYDASDFSEEFLSTITCDGGKTAPDVFDWEDLRDDKYSKLFDDDKTTLKNATASESGTAIEQAMARYDYIISKYNKSTEVYNNYISRSGSGIIANNPLSIDTSTATIIIIATSMAAITIIGGALILKRKEQ